MKKNLIKKKLKTFSRIFQKYFKNIFQKEIKKHANVAHVIPFASLYVHYVIIMSMIMIF
jgi:hypothetical protein